MTRNQPMTADTQWVRRVNRDAVFKLLIERGPISRTALARLTHLTPATVFSIADELVQQDLAQEHSIGHSIGGRRPMLFKFNPTAYAAIGVNIRSSQVTGVVAYLDGSICLTATRTYRVDSTIQVLSLTNEVIGELIASAPVPPDRLAGIGLAVPGLVDVERGQVIESVNWGWKDLPLRNLLVEKFSLPVCIDEDDNALAIGEGLFGAGRGTSNIVCIKVGRGLGAGIIIGGTLLRGADNTAGEIEHILVAPEGPQCYCGNYGCLTRMASTSAIISQAIRQLKQGAASVLLEMAHGDLDQITVGMIGEAASAGDALATQVIEQAGRYLGIGIAALVSFLNPDMVILGGGVIRAGTPILEPIRRIVRLRTLTTAGQRVQIVPAGLGTEAPAIGAAALVMIQQGLLPSNLLKLS
jgi:glucokinase-like ROK family protein